MDAKDTKEIMSLGLGDWFDVRVGGEEGTQGDAHTFRLGSVGEDIPEIRIQGSRWWVQMSPW